MRNFLNWFRQKQAKQTKEESSTIEQQEMKLVERETFTQDSYCAEITVIAPLSGSNRSGYWFYTLYQYSEETGKRELIGVSDVRDGDKALALLIARLHVNSLKLSNGLPNL